MKTFFIISLISICISLNLIFCENVQKKGIVSSDTVEKNKVITFRDQNGQLIRLDKISKSIVSMPRNTAAMVIAVDASEKRLKGIHIHSKQSLKESILNDIFPGIAKLRTDIVSHYNPNIEELLQINPDLVIQWGGKMFQKRTEKMEKVGLKVVSFNGADLSVHKDLIAGQIEIIGKVINKMNKAKKLIKWRTEIESFIKKIIAKIPELDRPKVLCLISFQSSYQYWESRSITLLQANYMSKSKKKNRVWHPRSINVEQIVEWNPEIILLGTRKNVNIQDIYKNKLFSDLNAVKNKRVYKFPLGGYKWGFTSHESPLAWMWMANILYPNYFNFNLRKEIKTWYKIMYGKMPTENEIDIILHVSMNKESKGYKKFL